jgi:hypothetical protein
MEGLQGYVLSTREIGRPGKLTRAKFEYKVISAFFNLCLGGNKARFAPHLTISTCGYAAGRERGIQKLCYHDDRGGLSHTGAGIPSSMCKGRQSVINSNLFKNWN